KLDKLSKKIINENHIKYSALELLIDRSKKNAKIIFNSPEIINFQNEKDILNQGDQFWLLKCARELDDILLHLRFNEL